MTQIHEMLISITKASALDAQTEALSRLRTEVQNLRCDNFALRQQLTTAEAKIVLLKIVAEAAKALVRGIEPTPDLYYEMVHEPDLTALESALAQAGYDLSDEELSLRLAQEDAEAFRGKEAASFEAEQMQAARKLK